MSQTREDEALQVAEEIVAVRARLAELQARFSALVSGGAKASMAAKKAAATKANGASSDSTDGFPSRVLAIFKRQPNKKVSLRDVIAEIKPSNTAEENLIRTAASRLARKASDRKPFWGLKRLSQGEYQYVPKEEA